MTYVEYCRMKCFSKLQNDKKDSTYTPASDEKAAEAGDKAYKASMKKLKDCEAKNGKDSEKCSDISPAADAENAYYSSLKDGTRKNSK